MTIPNIKLESDYQAYEEESILNGLSHLKAVFHDAIISIGLASNPQSSRLFLHYFRHGQNLDDRLIGGLDLGQKPKICIRQVRGPDSANKLEDRATQQRIRDHCSRLREMS
jgi:hypothetical protein